MTPRLHQPDEAATGDDLLTLSEVCRMLGVSVPTGERMKSAGKLPPCLELSRRVHRWRRATVIEFIRKLEADAIRRQARAR